MENTAVKPNYELMPWESVETVTDENGNVISTTIRVNASEMPPLNKIKHFAEQILDVALTNIPEDQEITHEYLESMHQELMGGFEEHLQNIDEMKKAVTEFTNRTDERMHVMMEAIQNMRVAVRDHVQFFTAPPSVN